MTLMPDDGLMRVLLVVVALVLAFPAPAHAAIFPDRVTEQGVADTSSPKTQDVTCPGTTVAFGLGGKVNGSNNNVVLTSVTVNSNLKTVTVTAVARNGYAGVWSLTAQAVCSEPDGTQPERISGLGTASCTGGRTLYSSGFAILSGGGDAYMREVVPSPDMTHVDVQAGGNVLPNSVMAVGICAYPGPDPFIDYDRIAAPGTVAPKPFIPGDHGSWMYGSGVKIIGTGWLTGMGVNEDLDAALTSVAKPYSFLMSNEDSATYGTYSGFWY